MLCLAQRLPRMATLLGIFVSLSGVSWGQSGSPSFSLPPLATSQVFRMRTPTPSDSLVDLPAPTSSESDGSLVPLIASQSLDPLNGTEPDFLQTLPRPPEQPRSLMQPAPPRGYPATDLENPYFGWDPLLDPQHWAQPGWFVDVQMAAIAPHVSNQMQETVTTTGGTPVNVQLGNASLGWTVAPRVEVGYRLTSGFGEISVADTGFSTGGHQNFLGPDGIATRSSTLAMNYTDIDYHSREYTPFDNWEMKWRVGLRVAETYTTTAVNEPFAQAAAGMGVIGSNVFSAQQTNRTWGIGPHFAVELERRIADSGFSLVGKIDYGTNYTMLKQSFSVATTTPDSGTQVDSFTNQSLMLNAQLGVAWQPPKNLNARVYLGYIEETWWDILANENAASQGQFYYQGVVLRASYNY